MDTCVPEEFSLFCLCLFVYAQRFLLLSQGFHVHIPSFSIAFLSRAVQHQVQSQVFRVHSASVADTKVQVLGRVGLSFRMFACI